MGMQAEGPYWDRQPGEDEDAYAAFLTYRDIGAGRNLEETRKRLARRPGDLHDLQEWSSRWDWRERAGSWDDQQYAERVRAKSEFTALWERRRLQAMEDGWRTCQALRDRLARMMAVAPEVEALAPPTPEPVPEAVATPEATSDRKALRRNDLAVIRLSRLIVEMEWALINVAIPEPGKFEPWKATDEELQVFLDLHPEYKPKHMRC